MKRTFIPLFIISIFYFANCSKHKDKPDTSGLPPATHEGKNIFGFLLNGQPWIPHVFQGNGVDSLSVVYDPNVQQGYFEIVAHNFISPSHKEGFILAISDSLNFINIPATFAISINSSDHISYWKTIDTNYCGYDTKDMGNSGSITITKLDQFNRIISGTFNATLIYTGCDIIRITDGRFDLKY